MWQFFTSQRFIKFIKVKQSETFIIFIIFENTSFNEFMIIIDIVKEKRVKWNLRYEFYINIIKNHFKNNLFMNHKDEVNAHILWDVIHKNNKFKGFNTFNDLYRQLFKLNLDQYKNVIDFIARLKNIYNDIINLSFKLKLKTNFFIFLFYTGLNKLNDAYFTYYIQNHKFINNVNIKIIYSLKYVIIRFIQIIINFFFER